MKLSSRFAGTILLTVACVVGCSKKQSESDSATTPPRTIAVLHHPGFADIADDISAEAVQNGFVVVPINEESKWDALDLDALVMCPARTMANVVDIPVFNVDFDHHAGGRMAADAIHDAVGGTGKVAILDHPAAASSPPRIQGFRERLTELNAADKVDIQVAAQLPGGTTRAQGAQSAQVLLMAQGGLNAMLALNEAAALGAHDAMVAATKADQVAIVGFSVMETGKVFASLVPIPAGIGAKTIETVHAFLDGESAEKEILIPMTLLRSGAVP